MIIDYAFDFKKFHTKKFKPSLYLLEGGCDSFWYDSYSFPPWSPFYVKYLLPDELEVPLVSIEWNPKKNLWIYGYGWFKYC